ncbi:MAG: hypothetical protein [Wendovervirus sonii]|uniref:Uncharacterized protein n=1 Tax=phage Lak_Megaphage_Sonny TaxID=3109229 RepID=A0ABZ0Z5E3_9CAUD|nr:MAG: hypothetical protein [phage Lak_Megaphage_Sonny]
MNDVQCMNIISKVDLENKGFFVDQIIDGEYTKVSFGDISGLVWFSPFKSKIDFYINFIAECSSKEFFRKLYENFDIILLDEDDYQIYNMGTAGLKELSESTKDKLTGTCDTIIVPHIMVGSSKIGPAKRPMNLDDLKK